MLLPISRMGAGMGLYGTMNALAQAVGEPRTFRLDAWMGLFDADNAGEMLVGQVSPA